jgi:hypothetical protein
MKDFLNIFIVIMLVGFVVGISYMQYTQPQSHFGILYLPWFILAISWGVKINKDYRD